MDALLEKLRSKKVPKEINIRIEEYSTVDSCFYNVQDKIAKDGGAIIYGWKLHESSILQEAERHAIWKSPTGELIDVTPDSNNKQVILFLEDDSGWEYRGQFSDNIRVNKTRNPLVDDFILLCETISQLWQTGVRKSRMEIEILEPVYLLINRLEEDKRKREFFILKGNTTESLCYCHSGFKYKNCHGHDLKNIYTGLMKKADDLVKSNY